MRGNTRFRTARSSLFALICISLLAAGCSKSEQDDGSFNASRLPRVSGAKEVFASPATTIFTSPEPVAQTADTLEKALVAGGWQRFVAPNTAYRQDPAMRSMQLKKGMQALNVYISIAPAQNNATSVQYSALPLKTDLPFTKDATSIEYSPERPLLTLLTAEPVDKALDFYRKELGARGWSMWSEKTNGKAPADAPSGVVHDNGAYAHYITDKDPSVALVVTLQKADAGKLKVELKQWPVGILADLHQVYVDSDNHGAALADVAKLPRLEGATERLDRSSKDKIVYSVPATLANTTDALVKLLGAEGWKPYVAPLEERHSILMAFKKAGQGLSVSFTIQPGKNEQTSEVTTVYYSPTRLRFAPPVPDDASDIVFDENRPYLNLMTASSLDATRDFYNKRLTAVGWMPLSSADAAAKWPNAKLDDNAAYFDRGNKRPIMLSLQPRDGKTNAEIRVAPFALTQNLEADSEVFGLPRPKQVKTSGGTDGRPREMHAHVMADVETVLAFYRRELTARNWKEETQGAVITPDEVVLKFSPPDGSAVLKLSRKYDLTVVSIVQEIPKAAPKAESAAGIQSSGNDSIDAMMRQAQQMIRDATADSLGKMNAPKPAPPANGPNEALGPLAGSDVPVPLPAIAEDIDFGNGRLEFTAATDVRMVADFYRSTMKQQGWNSQSSVINNANMVVLNFAKAGKSVSFTIMKMGNKTNVSADGSALTVATAKSAPPAAVPSDKAAAADTPSQPATEDDLIVEESGGLPMPKRHTLSEGSKSPFRRELNANVPLNLADVLGFYRRELGKLNWKEESKGAVVAADNVKLAYSSANGPAMLTLSRKDGETIVNLVASDPDAAAKAGVLPKPGQVKLLVTNPNDVEAVLTINKQTIKAAAGSGTKAPDGAMLDLPPGKHKFSIKVPGKPASNDEMEVGADETWGLLIGPVGALPIRVY
jgi:hypothetical protein